MNKKKNKNDYQGKTSLEANIKPKTMSYRQFSSYPIVSFDIFKQKRGKGRHPVYF